MPHIPLQIRNCLKEVAEELGQPYQLIENIYYQQFEFLRNAMEEGQKGEYSTFNNVLLKHFGTFYVNEKRFNKIFGHDNTGINGENEDN